MSLRIITNIWHGAR